MRTLFLSLTAIGLASMAQAEITEQVVTLSSGGQPFVGTLATPAGDPAPVVLLLHGFTGARNELATDHVSAGVFAHSAQKLGEAGFASLRIDFRGSGESTADLSFADTTFEGQIADAAAAVDYLAGLDSVDGQDIHVIGWSQGGLVAASLAGRGAAVDTVSLWNAVGDPTATYGGLLGAEFLTEAIAASADEVITATLPWGAEIELKGAFFDGIAAHDPIKEIAGYSGPLFVATGTNDTVVLPENGEAFMAAHDGAEVLWSAEMDHVFNVFGTGETLDLMLAETIGFIQAHDD
ncbi:MAG: alpha/beta hydrolase family protein [Paracoccaceae bacterium]